MTATDYITDTAAQLTEWGIDYRETTEGLSVGSIHLEITEDGYRPAGTILNGTETVATTSDADKAAALLAFPLARRAWELGYSGDFEIDVLDGFLDMRLSYWGDSVTLSGDAEASSEFTVAEHPLLRKQITMSDLGAVLESVELTCSNPEGAWQGLCWASDFDGEYWEDIVEFLNEDVHITHGARFTKVESYQNERIALVEDWDNETPTRVIDIETAEDVARREMSDIAAAVLCAIS